MKKILFIFVTICTFPSYALNVVTSIKPIQMITTELTLGITKPDVVLQSNASPHDYALRPSDVKKMHQADLMIWFGHDLEPFLAKSLEGKANSFEIHKISDLKLHKFAHGNHHNEHEIDEHGHHHSTYDPHFWLGITQTMQVAKGITQQLVQVDPKHAQTYQANLGQFLQQLTVTKQKIKQQLQSVQNKGYYVFHDAYGYFEKQFGLSQLGHFTVSPERKPGAKTLIKIRTTLKDGKASCVFSEPQFTPAVIHSVTRGTEVYLGELDPLGSGIKVDKGSYFELLQSIADSFAQCLGKS